MFFKFPVVELVDRYTIAIVKYEKTGGANQLELNFYRDQMVQLDMDAISPELEHLTDIHRQIWALEDDFKKCRIDNAPLAEIGQKALDIRDLNNERVAYRNKIATAVGCSIREIKQ